METCLKPTKHNSIWTIILKFNKNIVQWKNWSNKPPHWLNSFLFTEMKVQCKIKPKVSGIKPKFMKTNFKRLEQFWIWWNGFKFGESKFKYMQTNLKSMKQSSICWIEPQFAIIKSEGKIKFDWMN